VTISQILEHYWREKMKILGIDDNQDLLDLCEAALSSEGYEYTGIDNGKEGLKLIRNQQFDIVFLDLSMPEFSGMDVMNSLVEEGIMNKQKVVIFTATTPTKKDMDLFLEKGAHSVLTKPIDADTLVAHVQKIESESTA